MTRPLMFWMALPFLLIAVTIWETCRSTRNVLKRCVVTRPTRDTQASEVTSQESNTP